MLDDGAAAPRRHVVPLRARGARPARGHAVRRRGRAVRARRRARGRDGGAEPRPARRPEPAAAGLAGLAPAGRGRVGARSTCSATTRRCGRTWASSSSSTWRMRPEVNAFISDDVLRGAARAGARSRCDAVARGRATASASSPVEHDGHRHAVAGGGGGGRAPRSSGSSGRRTWTSDGERPLRPRGRHRRRALQRARALPARAAPGRRSRSARWTSSRASRRRSSSTRWRARAAEDVPRGLDFLFSRNRLNVAISRAQCLAYLVASPRLLDANCRTVEQMRLANALCRLVESAM